MRHGGFHFQGFPVCVLSSSSVLAVSFLFKTTKIHQNMLGNQSQQQRLVFNHMNITEKLKLRPEISILIHTFVHTHRKII